MCFLLILTIFLQVFGYFPFFFQKGIISHKQNCWTILFFFPFVYNSPLKSNLVKPLQRSSFLWKKYLNAILMLKETPKQTIIDNSKNTFFLFLPSCYIYVFSYTINFVGIYFKSVYILSIFPLGIITEFFWELQK